MSEYDIIERTGQAEYYLREARRAGLALPAYVTIHAVSDCSPRSSRISIQLDSTEDVSQWALHFGVGVEFEEIGPSARLGDDRYHDVKVYYNYPVPADEPMSLSDVTETAPIDPPSCLTCGHMRGSHFREGCDADLEGGCPCTQYAIECVGLAAHTEVACDTITRAASC